MDKDDVLLMLAQYGDDTDAWDEIKMRSTNERLEKKRADDVRHAISTHRWHINVPYYFTSEDRQSVNTLIECVGITDVAPDTILRTACS